MCDSDMAHKEVHIYGSFMCLYTKAFMNTGLEVLRHCIVAIHVTHSCKRSVACCIPYDFKRNFKDIKKDSIILSSPRRLELEMGLCLV